MEALKKRLKEKGWKSKEINKTIRIVKKVKKKKQPAQNFLDKLVYWIALLIVVSGNITISIALIPSLIVLNSTSLYLVIIIIGLSFGFLFELVIRSIEHLEAKHYIFLSILVPVIAIINFVIIVNFSNEFAGIMNIGNTNNPVLIGLAYSLSFMFPFIYFKLILKKGYYS